MPNWRRVGSAGSPWQQSLDTENRERQVSFALRAYASLATSADEGAVRDKSKPGVNDGRPITFSAPRKAPNI